MELNICSITCATFNVYTSKHKATLFGTGIKIRLKSTAPHPLAASDTFSVPILAKDRLFIPHRVTPHRQMVKVVKLFEVENVFNYNRNKPDFEQDSYSHERVGVVS